MLGCKNDPAPIPVKKMANILREIHLAESFSQLVPIDEGGYMNKNRDTLMVLYQHIYQRHNIDTASFAQAMDWYKTHPKQFDAVYEQVLAQLSIQKEVFKDSTREYEDSTLIN